MSENNKSPCDTMILMYHEVTNNPEREKTKRKIDPAYSLFTGQFEAQMAFIVHSHDLKVISLDELRNTEATRLSRIALTFDDGLRGNYECAFKILEHYGFPATFFVTVNNIASPRFMNWDHLAELYRCGHSVQSHTMTHPMLGECDANQIRNELDESKKIIEDKIGAEVRYLSLPYGSWNENVINIAQQVGYSAVFTSSLVGCRLNHRLYQYGRIPIKDTYSMQKFAALLQPTSWQSSQLKSINTLKNIAQKMLGLNNYRKIYRLIHRIEL